MSYKLTKAYKVRKKDHTHTIKFTAHGDLIHLSMDDTNPKAHPAAYGFMSKERARKIYRQYLDLGWEAA